MTTLIAKPNLTVSTSPYLATVAVTGAGYVIMEMIRHGLIEGTLIPWLTSIGLSASAVMYLSYALIVVGIMALAWMIYKFFLCPQE